MIVGYARVSTNDQSFDDQVTALNGAGAQRIWQEVGGDMDTARPGLADLIEHLGSGDELVVTALDRIGCSSRYVLDTLTALSVRGVKLNSLRGGVGGISPGPATILQTFTMAADFEDQVLNGVEEPAPRSARAEADVLPLNDLTKLHALAKLARELLDHGATVDRIATILEVDTDAVADLVAAPPDVTEDITRDITNPY